MQLARATVMNMSHAAAAAAAAALLLLEWR